MSHPAALLERAWVAIGATCATLVNLLEPEVIVIGGSIAEHHPRLFVVRTRGARRRAFPIQLDNVRIEPAELGADVSLIGSLPIVNDRLDDPAYYRSHRPDNGRQCSKEHPPVTTRIGINGFGRIGRQTLKAILERHPRLEVVASTISPTTRRTPTCSSTTRPTAVRGEVDGWRERDHRRRPAIRSFSEKDPGGAAVGRLGVDIVIESTGIFTDATKAKAHSTPARRR